MDIKVDTEVLEQSGLGILNSISVYKEVINNLYETMNNMVERTHEWVGNGATIYVDKFNEDYKFFSDINDNMVKYGQFLIDYSKELEIIAKRF